MLRLAALGLGLTQLRSVGQPKPGAASGAQSLLPVAPPGLDQVLISALLLPVHAAFVLARERLHTRQLGEDGLGVDDLAGGLVGQREVVHSPVVSKKCNHYTKNAPGQCIKFAPAIGCCIC